MSASLLRMFAASALVALLMVIGCAGTEPSRFYLLNPLTVESETKRPVPEHCVSLAIDPVRLPEYLDRPQIVTRSGKNELLLAQYDRWAEPLAETFPRILAQDLSHLICTKAIFLYPFRSSVDYDYRIKVEIIRMDGTLGEGTVLEAWWSITQNTEKPLVVTRRSILAEPSKTGDYGSLVEAHSRAVSLLSRAIADEITRLERGVPERTQ
jgi:uncharacterized protein